MLSQEQVFSTRIVLNSEQAKRNITELQRKVEELKKKRDDAWAANKSTKEWDKITKQIIKAEGQLKAYLGRQYQINKTLDNMSLAKPKELKATMKAIHGMLDDGTVKRGSEEWKALQATLGEVNNELKKIKAESSVDNGGGLQGFLKKFNNIGFAVTNALAIKDRSVDFSKEYVDAYAKMDEAMTDVMKYTGQTKEQVEHMNEAFKKMETRTAREELNALAGAAGRLGITAEKDIIGFVDAADKINVALGDDLGEGAIDQIGKLTMVFGEDKTKGLNGAMLATGSAINVLGANSSANTGFITEFTSSMAGMAVNAKISQTDIMGYASALSQAGIEGQTASGVFAQLITKMFTDPAKFAKAAGLEVKSFSNLLKTDANAAILQFLEGLKARGGFESLAPALKSLKMQGTQAVPVISSLINKIDELKEAQDVAKKAYDEGTSIIDEFTNANSSAQAQLEMAEKALNDVKVELGQELMPIVTASTKGTREAINVLVQIIRWTKENTGTIIKYAIELAIVTAAVKASAIAEKAKAVATAVSAAATKGAALAEKAYASAAMFTKNVLLALQLSWTLLTKGVQAYTVQIRAARIASLTNPWTALATVLLTVGVAVYELVTAFSKETDAARKAKAATEEFNAKQKLLKSVSEEANSSISEEMTRFNQLRKTLEDNKAKLDDRKKALVEIKKLCPEYHGQLTTENRLINSNTTALDGYITNLKRAALARAAFNKMVAIQENSLNHEQLLQGRQANRKWAQGQLTKAGVEEGGRVVRMAGTGGLLGTRGYYAIIGADGKVQKKIEESEGKRLIHMQELVEWNNKRIAQEQTVLDLNGKQSDMLEKIVKENGGTETTTTTTVPTTPTGGDGGGGGSGKKTKKTGSTTNKEETERKKKMRKEIEDQKALNDQLQAQNMSQYYQGEKTYREYITKQHELTIEGYDALMDIYKKYGENYLQLSDERARAEMAKEQEVGRFKLKELDRCYQLQKVMIQQQYYDRSSDMYQNEEAMNEALFMQEIAYLEDKKALYREGTEEYAEIEAEITIREQEHKLDLEQQYQERLEQYREEWLNIGNEKQMAIAMQGLETLHKNGLLKEEEYQRMKMSIQAQYAKSPVEKRNEDFDANVNDAVAVAKSKASGGYDKSQSMSMTNNPIMGEITQYKSVMEQLKILREQDKISHQEYQQAKADVTAEFLTNMVSQVQAAYDSINNVMSAASSFYAAQSQYEQNVTAKKYDKMIEKAGNNQVKQKKLEEKKQKELAKIKNKYNKKAMKIELAQAVASTALAAINSYASASKINWILGAVAAAMATAAGMLQIAAIKKQHAAEEAGYYEGGFTGGSSYRKKAGIVHQGEFVVNHAGVKNENLMPILRLFDTAQRNNTIGSLTAADVSQQLGQGGAVVAPVVNVQNDNEELSGTLGQMNESIDRLNYNLEHPTPNPISVEEFDRKLDIFKSFKKNT